MSLVDSWNHLYKIRPIIRPNRGFARILSDYEADVFNQKRTLLPIWMSSLNSDYINYIDFLYRYHFLIHGNESDHHVSPKILQTDVSR